MHGFVAPTTNVAPVPSGNIRGQAPGITQPPAHARPAVPRTGVSPLVANSSEPSRDKYGVLASRKPSPAHMMLNRRKPQKNYFDSGDYNMARQMGAGRSAGSKGRAPLSSMVTGTMAPTPEAVEMTRHPHHEQSKLVVDKNPEESSAPEVGEVTEMDVATPHHSETPQETEQNPSAYDVQ